MKMTDREKDMVRQMIANSVGMLNVVQCLDKEPNKAAAVLGGVIEVNKHRLDRMQEDPEFKTDFEIILQQQQTEFKEQYKQNNPLTQ